MDALALSPRRKASPSRRAQRFSASPAACVDVQWTFLPMQPPLRPSNTQHPSPIKALDVFGSTHAREELQVEQLRLRRSQDAADQQQHRVLYDLMGETQRKAMLDKVMADMEAMALTPVRRFGQTRHHVGKPSRVPSATTRRSSMAHAKTRADDVALLPQRRLSALGRDEDQDEDEDEARLGKDTVTHDGNEQGESGNMSDRDELDLPELREIRERHHQRVQGKSTPNTRQFEAPILWQKTAHVRMALDLPPELAAFDGEGNIGQDTNTPASPLSDLFPLSEESVREQQRYLTKRASKLQESGSSKSPETKTKAVSPRKLNATGSPACTDLTSQRTRPKRVRKAHYGSWYVPRSEWWPHHENEQDALAALYPDEIPSPVERHQCTSTQPQERPKKAPVLPEPDHPYRWPSVLRAPIRAASLRPSITRPPTSPVSGSAMPIDGASSPRGSYMTPRSLDSPHQEKDGPVWSPRSSASPEPISQRVIELQNEISQTYIAREYRNYLVAKGARIPGFLNY